MVQVLPGNTVTTVLFTPFETYLIPEDVLLAARGPSVRLDAMGATLIVDGTVFTGSEAIGYGIFATVSTDIVVGETGRVLSGRLDRADFVPLALRADDSNLTNFGEIGGFLAIDAGDAARTTIVNHGDIFANDDPLAVAVDLSGSLDAAVLNTGTITGGTGIAGGGASALAVGNSGGIVGFANAVTLGRNGDLDNTGHVEAVDGDAIRVDGGTIRNTGTILAGSERNAAAIRGEGTGSERILNEGVILGDVLLGDGDDQLSGTGRIAGRVNGGAGADTLAGSAAADDFSGEAGDDVLAGAHGDDTLSGGEGDDRIAGGEGDDAAVGEAGADSIAGGTGDDAIDGGAGADTIRGGDGEDMIAGGEDDDRIAGGSGEDTADGGEGTDTVRGGDGEDRLAGGEGDDRIAGGSGDDDIDGGAGDDRAAGGAGEDTLAGSAGRDTLSGGSGSDAIDGGEDDDRLFGGADDDAIVGGSGADRLLGNAGEDALDGGEGEDTLKGGAGEDTADGGAGGDVLAGGSGDDALSGGEGEDTLAGGRGDDMLTGGAGADVFRVRPNDGFDVIVDFEDGLDAVDLSAFGLEAPARPRLLFRDTFSFSLRDGGEGAVEIHLDRLGGEGTIRIEGLDARAVDLTDFIL